MLLLKKLLFAGSYRQATCFHTEEIITQCMLHAILVVSLCTCKALTEAPVVSGPWGCVQSATALYNPGAPSSIDAALQLLYHGGAMCSMLVPSIRSIDLKLVWREQVWNG